MSSSIEENERIHCPSLSKLGECLYGNKNKNEKHIIKNHLNECPFCENELNELKEFVGENPQSELDDYYTTHSLLKTTLYKDLLSLTHIEVETEKMHDHEKIEVYINGEKSLFQRTLKTITFKLYEQKKAKDVLVEITKNGEQYFYEHFEDSEISMSLLAADTGQSDKSVSKIHTISKVYKRRFKYKIEIHPEEGYADIIVEI